MIVEFKIRFTEYQYLYVKNIASRRENKSEKVFSAL